MTMPPTRRGFAPDWRVPPGETISECLIERNMSRRDLGRAMRMPMEQLRALMKGERVITPAVADQLERVLGVSARFWLQAEANYRKPVV